MSWRTTPGLRWRQVRGSLNWIVYHPGSGDVHLLTPSARDLWQTIDREPGASFEALAAALATAESGPADLAETIHQTIAVMDKSGLIEPVKIR